MLVDRLIIDNLNVADRIYDYSSSSRLGHASCYTKSSYTIVMPCRGVARLFCHRHCLDILMFKFEIEQSLSPLISNLTDPVLVGDPSIEHGIVTNWQKRFSGFLPWAHFRDEKGAVARLFLQYGSIGDNEPTCKNKRATGLYWWSYVRRRQVPSSKRCFVVLLPFKFQIPRCKKRSTGSI
jgi:hypothetical protein